MLLTPALFKSEHGCATRRKLIASAAGRKPAKFEYHMAFVSQNGAVNIHNGRNGTIRRMEAADQLFDDWEPFQPTEMPARVNIKRIKILADKS